MADDDLEKQRKKKEAEKKQQLKHNVRRLDRFKRDKRIDKEADKKFGSKD